MLRARLFLVLLVAALFGCTGYVGYQLVGTNPVDAHGVPGQAVRADRELPPPPPLPLPPATDLLPVEADQARRINAQQPFVQAPNPAAAPFMFSGNGTDRERALTCLTAAVYYEAGDDTIGQSAVAQVILNRMRHPAFPKTICGVVFQGSERRTGCQFTFTCDGALARKPPAPAWLRARGAAGAALAGFVFAPVGYATHYHTDWVVPVWSASMDKLTNVHTHLFFRWPGYYGKPAAFTGRYSGGEIIDARIEPLMQAEATGAGLVASNGDDTKATTGGTIGRVEVAGINDVDLSGSAIKAADRASGQFLLKLEPSAFPGSFAVLSFKLCADLPSCEIWGWTDAHAIPGGFPVTGAARTSASFHYLKTRERPTGSAFWNCRQFARASAAQCIPVNLAAER